MNVLITGGRGFLGRHVAAHALGRGHRVRILARSAGSAEHGSPVGVETAFAELRDRQALPAALAGIDAVVHCAASMATDAALQQADTIDATLSLLHALEGSGVRHIVGISTLAVYDYHAIREGSVLDEESPLEDDVAARSPYVAAKQQQETAILERSNAGGWRCIVLRPGLVFGPGRTWFHHLGVRLSPRRWLCYAPHSLLPLAHVDGCAEAVVLALECRANGAVINIVDDALPDRLQYMERLSLRAAPPPSIQSVPWPLLDRLSGVVSWAQRGVLFGKVRLPSVLDQAELHARCKPLRYSNGLAMSTLGWRPRSDWRAALDLSLGAPDGGEHTSVTPAAG